MSDIAWREIVSFAAGLAGIGILLIVVWFVVRTMTIEADPTKPGPRHRWLALIEGKDGRLSTSKFQWLAWTAVVVAGFSAIYAARVLRSDLNADIGVTPYILTALGFSTVTMATSKGVTMLYSAGGRVPPSSGGTLNGGILTDDDGIADLSKIQLVTWTVIAIGIWLFLVIAKVSDISWAHDLNKIDRNLPDIPLTLMVLMGLSQAGYLGKKIASPDRFTFAIDTLVPSVAQPKEIVATFGQGFNDVKTATSAVTVGGLRADTSYWSDNRIEFQVPALSPDGNPWKPNEPVDVFVVIDGFRSDKPANLVVNGPPPATIAPGS